MDAAELVTSYIANGIAVFPLHGVDASNRCDCRRGCPSPAKHPRFGLAHGKNDPRRNTCRGECGMLGHGLHDATTDPGQVAEWLAQYPAGNWGIRPPLGVLVLDIDPRNDGHLTMRALEAEHGRLPATLTAQTGSGGWHVWLSYNGPTRGKLGAGIDVKTNTGYLVAPPSQHIAGGTYQWINQRPAAYAPQWVKDKMNPPQRLRAARLLTPTRPGAGRALVERVAKTPFGEINDVVYWAACRADESGILDDLVEQLVDAAATAAGSHATAAGEHQTRRTIDSARRRPPDELRLRRDARRAEFKGAARAGNGA